ncbi:MAG: muconolactone Delta-isomerase family protein [Actinobacteria bacterium]|nr:muconolactone Delta-isomerase family protein [Actinomycetota bacterium]
MRFLIIDRGTTVETQQGVPPNIFHQAKEWVQEKMGEGKIAMAYALAGEHASCLVLDVDSLEELDDLLMEYPLSAYSIFEIYALSDIARSYDKAAKIYAKAARPAA